MAVLFNGSTDRIDYPNIKDPYDDAFSFAAWLTMGEAQPSAGNGYLLTTHLAGDTDKAMIALYQASGQAYKLGVSLYFDTQTLYSYKWNWGGSTNTLFHFCVTYPGNSLDYTDVIHYFNGQTGGQYHASQDGIGSAITSPGSWSIGGRIYSDDTNWNGLIAHVGYWDRQLSPGEVALLAAGYSPLTISNGLLFAPPMINSPFDYASKQMGVVDGTSTVDGPHGIIYPALPFSHVGPKPRVRPHEVGIF